MAAVHPSRSTLAEYEADHRGAENGDQSEWRNDYDQRKIETWDTPSASNSSATPNH
jgi:hypothetical protein